MSDLEITVVVENTATSAGLLAEHGLACWIRDGEANVLFDTGQGLTLRHNAQKLNIALERATAVVLSHGHYDHTGGLPQALEGAPSATLFAHPDWRAARYLRTTSGAVREIGVPAESLDVCRRQGTVCRQTTEPTPITAHLMVTGPIPRRTEFEDVGGAFYRDPETRQLDPIADDQALYFQTLQGTVVLLGCAHAGVINTLHYVQQLTDGRPIHAVLGGMHLAQASDERLEQTIQALVQLGVKRVGPVHCTGSRAVAALWSAFPQHCFDFHVGSRVTFSTLTS